MALPAIVASTDYAPKSKGPALVALPGGKVGVPEETRLTLTWLNYPFFLSQLHDEKGDPVIVAEHHEEWAGLMQTCPLLVLLAPRDHGKTYTSRGYLMWRAWRHNRDPFTGELMEDLPEGKFEAVLFSDTLDQAKEFFEGFQSLMLANEELFHDVLPTFKTGKAATIRGVWSRTRVRLKNRFEISIRAYRTSTRGLHPNLIICDDILSDKNSATEYQRGKMWNYFVGTLLPMNPEQVIVIGTAQHYDDLLHRLRPDPEKPPLVVRNRKVRFRWMKYRSVDWDTKTVLWPRRHDYADLEGRRALDPIIFSREWQNDPRDDASSMFPYPLTQSALNAHLRFQSAYVKQAGEFTVLGYDIARSESVGADYTVCWVASYNPQTQRRRLLRAWREKGLGFDMQIALLRAVCAAFYVDVGVVEENGFQKWLHTETLKYPETAGRLIGHRTGAEKANIEDGVPSLKLSLQQGLWEIPAYGGEDDPEALNFARIWQSEANAFGWKDGKLQGVGEHDDTVMAWFFAEKAVREINAMRRQQPAEQIIHAADVGIEERVSIDPSY